MRPARGLRPAAIVNARRFPVIWPGEEGKTLGSMNGTTVFLTAIGYVLLLFLIAWWGDRGGRRFVSGAPRAVVYALSLAVYCTSWTYYGSVGLASRHGLDFLPIYIGPILVIGLGAPFVGRIANLARAQNLTTVADFVSARYGKSQAVAAAAALIALVGSAPYVALQLKAVSTTLLTVVDSFERSRLVPDKPSSRSLSRSPSCSPPSPSPSARGGSIRRSIRTVSSSRSPSS